MRKQRAAIKVAVFEMLVRLGEDSCFQCGEPLDVQTLSIEHKVPLSVDPTRALDPSNLAWSHLVCNQRQGGRVTGNRHQGTGHMSAVGKTGKGNCYRWNIMRGLGCVCGLH